MATAANNRTRSLIVLATLAISAFFSARGATALLAAKVLITPGRQQPVEHRDEEYCDHRGGKRATDDTGTNRLTAVGRGAGRNCKRYHAQNERKRRHNDGPQSQPRRFNCCIKIGHAFLVIQFNRKLDDQNRIFCSQTYQGQQTNLEVQIVINTSQQDCNQRSEYCKRHG